MPSPTLPWTPGSPVHLETRRLIVRTLAPSDISPTLTEWNADPAIANNLWHPSVPPELYFKGLIAASDQKTRFSFLIVHKTSSRAIGYVKLQVDPHERVQVPTVALGDRAYWNLELGTEATRAVTRFAFEHLPVDHVECRVYAENTKVHGRLLRYGYEHCGTYREVLPQRPPRDVHVFRTNRAAWLERAAQVDAHLATLPDAPLTS